MHSQETRHNLPYKLVVGTMGRALLTHPFVGSAILRLLRAKTPQMVKQTAMEMELDKG